MPSEEIRTLRLKDGRKLAYAEYGDPSGRPVFYFHGFPSCHLEISLADETAKRLGVRLIALDRPGFGLSGFQRRREIDDWPDDVKEAAEQIGIRRFAALGVSGGGPTSRRAAPDPELPTAPRSCQAGLADQLTARSGLRWSSGNAPSGDVSRWSARDVVVRLNARLFPRFVPPHSPPVLRPTGTSSTARGAR
jgi:pimeloyl-ACP methyl ester carboxylesterase